MHYKKHAILFGAKKSNEHAPQPNHLITARTSVEKQKATFYSGLYAFKALSDILME